MATDGHGFARIAIAAWFLTVSALAQNTGFDSLAHAADQARESNRPGDAIPLYRQALALKPSWQEGAWYLATLLYDQENFGESRDLLRRFVADNPDAGPAWVILGMSEFHTKDYSKALADLERGLTLGLGEREQMTRSAHFLVIALLTRAGRFEEALDMFLRRAQTEHADSFGMQAAGLAALRVSLLPSEIPPGQRAMFQLAGSAVFSISCHDNDGAARLIKKLIDAYPNQPGVHFFYGALLMDSSPESGIAEMKRELELSPDSAPARIRLAEEYLREGKPQVAMPFAREAVRLDPRSPFAHLILAKLLQAQKDNPGALHELEIARDEAPQDSIIRWMLCQAYRRVGREADAKREAAEVERLKERARNILGAL